MSGSPKNKANYMAVAMQELKKLSAINGFNISDERCLLLAQAMLTAFPHESILDIIQPIRDASIGKYGKLYENVSADKIFDWIKTHLESKYSHKEAMLLEEKNKREPDKDYPPIDYEKYKQRVAKEKAQSQEPTADEALAAIKADWLSSPQRQEAIKELEKELKANG